MWIVRSFLLLTSLECVFRIMHIPSILCSPSSRLVVPSREKQSRHRDRCQKRDALAGRSAAIPATLDSVHHKRRLRWRNGTAEERAGVELHKRHW